jgi:hypothetical protein
MTDLILILLFGAILAFGIGNAMYLYMISGQVREVRKEQLGLILASAERFKELTRIRILLDSLGIALEPGDCICSATPDHGSPDPDPGSA